MRVFRMYTKPSGHSAAELHEVPMTCDVHLAMPDDFDISAWPLARMAAK